AARPLRWTDINATVTTRRATAHDQQNRREGNMSQRNQTQVLRASALCIGIGFALGPMAAVAQDAPGEGGQATTLDRIEVTGSRIKRADIEGSLPITVIDRAEIDASGDISVADFLRNTTFNTFGSFRPRSGS